ncbi:MAG: carboxy terminal-processing peptidase [Bacteroidales bacterium]|jgi:carboxyl-terminal processing protease|nr:carboxy terminal-processing peptidase [Bacteroidales bacterium]
MSIGKSFFKRLGNRIVVPLAILALVFASVFLYSFCTRHSDKNELLLRMNMQLLMMQHFNPPAVNDSFSIKAFDAYLKKLDPFKQYLTLEDVRQLSEYRLKVDDQISDGTYELYDLSLLLWDKRFNETQTYYHEILKQPFDFSTEETYETDSDKTDWAVDNKELKEMWRKELKYRTLVNLSAALKKQENAPDSVKNKSFEEMEAEARENVQKLYDDRRRLKEDDRFSLYLNAITSVFDPHTQYQTPSAKANFDIKVSGQFEGIGATLQQSDGYAKVVDITPGSASWRQGELKINDLIMTVKQENETEAVDIYGMVLDDAVQLIRGKKGTKVTLTVKRIDGSMHEITITRDVVILEETYAKSAILTSPENKTRVGYIYLPGFYNNFRRMTTERSSSVDVAKEVEKLQKENVQGIILDLRDNLGGVLEDAVRMSGLFVDGPIVQIKQKTGLVQAASEKNMTPKYDGPLVIMVNATSASASEILAAAMQDYKRAVIIGGPQTFGKGTVQALVDLDAAFSDKRLDPYRPFGLLRLTIQKFYRINGGSTQLKGVTPDIIFPDLYSELGVGERFEDNCMAWTSVMPTKYSEWKSPVSVEQLRKKSAERTVKNENFQTLSEQINFLKKMKAESIVSLKLDDFRQADAKRIEENKRFEESAKKQIPIAIAIPKVDSTEMAGDSAKIARSEKWLSSLKKDIFLEEAVAVIGDLKK